MKIIAINGASASGKTTLAKSLCETLNQKSESHVAQLLSQDSYYLPHPDLSVDERALLNFDHPDAFDWPLLIEQLKQLKNGHNIEVPDYCFFSHNRTSKKTLLKPSDILIIEGLHLLNDKALASVFDYSIYLDTPVDLCLARRLLRDTQERGRSSDAVIEQYLATVRPMYLQFIAPSREDADLVLSGDIDELTLLRDSDLQLKNAGIISA